ncbi:MAG: lysine--tRNA ligase, partial [Patescibacteria group bacterium]
LRERQVNPYPDRASFSCAPIAVIRASFKKLSERGSAVGIQGRILAKREHGGAVFIDVAGGGSTLQVFLAKDKLGEGMFNLFMAAADIGDFIAVGGKPFYTKREEMTIEAAKWEMLAKSLRPLPEKWHGLQDVEERFRKRYLDILMNPEVRARFELRARLVAELRTTLVKEGYIEVETPILQPLYGGALAEPFLTHHRALEMDMYLRVAPELYLKRLLVAGFEKIYEIGKNFRNEGIDATHNPEFTTIELYAAYMNAASLRDFIAGVLHNLIKKVTGTAEFEFEGHKIAFPKKISTIPFWTVLERHALIPRAELLSLEELSLRARQFGLSPEPHEIKEKIANEIFSKICRPKMIQPTYVVDYPVAISPLAKNIPGKPDVVDRFQLIVGGIEVVNAFSELNDPREQRSRFEFQEGLREGADKEAHPMDEDFVEALEYGMPPAAGLAVSIDRITMLLTNTRNIKEVIIFPTLKRKE